MNNSFKLLIFCIFFIIISFTQAAKANYNVDFNNWLNSFKKTALKKGISQQTIDLTFKNVKFLEQVIKYDRKQPEFFEDTITYVSKRANQSRARKASQLLKKK